MSSKGLGFLNNKHFHPGSKKNLQKKLEAEQREKDAQKRRQERLLEINKEKVGLKVHCISLHE